MNLKELLKENIEIANFIRKAYLNDNDSVLGYKLAMSQVKLLGNAREITNLAIDLKLKTNDIATTNVTFSNELQKIVLNANDRDMLTYRLKTFCQNLEKENLKYLKNE